VEVNKDRTKIRRTGNAPLPERAADTKKRVKKVEEKKEAKANGQEEEKEAEEVERDE